MCMAHIRLGPRRRQLRYDSKRYAHICERRSLQCEGHDYDSITNICSNHLDHGGIAYMLAIVLSEHRASRECTVWLYIRCVHGDNLQQCTPAVVSIYGPRRERGRGAEHGKPETTRQHQMLVTGWALSEEHGQKPRSASLCPCLLILMRRFLLIVIGWRASISGFQSQDRDLLALVKRKDLPISG